MSVGLIADQSRGSLAYVCACSLGSDALSFVVPAINEATNTSTAIRPQIRIHVAPITIALAVVTLAAAATIQAAVMETAVVTEAMVAVIKLQTTENTIDIVMQTVQWFEKKKHVRCIKAFDLRVRARWHVFHIV